MKQLLQKILYNLSRGVLKRQKPKVVGITGTVGKTSTKDAVFTVLKKDFKVRTNIKNYNNEIGVPLTIIGCTSGNKNPFKWLYIFIKAISLSILPWPYPKILILEMGADKPGDIEYLTKLAPCYVGVVTAIGDKAPVHVEFFKNASQLVKEKMKIVKHIDKNGFAVLNGDDKRIMEGATNIKAQPVTFGHKEEDNIYISEEKIKYDVDGGINFKVVHKGNTVPFQLKNVLGIPQVYSAGAAIAIGLIFEMNLVEISQALKEYVPPKGRMNLIPGIKYSYLIDDSYNSSPEASEIALKFLSKAKVEGRKFACLGSMEELGEHTAKAHQDIGKLVYDLGINYLVTVGDKAENIAKAAKKAGMQDKNIFIYKTSDKAGLKLQELVHENDLILIKGSQSARTEKVTKELMADPLHAKDLLVRQDKTWEDR